MEKSFEGNLADLNEQEREKIFEEWERQWKEFNVPQAQVTHVTHHPMVEEFAKHKEVVPFMLRRIKNDITWTFPLWKYLENELDEKELQKIEEGIDPKIEAEETDNPLWNKIRDLEGKRRAIIKYFGIEAKDK